jgi:hypothetical protein
VSSKNSAVVSVDDVIERILATVAKVEDGTISPANAHLELKAYNAVLAAVKVKLDHARMTGRLISGSPSIPNATFGGVVDIESARRLAERGKDAE